VFSIVEAAIYKLSVLGLCLSFAIILGAAETLGLVQALFAAVLHKKRSFYI
jgi:hypothetical protein